MTTDPSIWSTALQLGIGGLSVAGIIYVALKSAETLREIQKEHTESIYKMQGEFLRILTDQISKNTVALTEVAKVLGRAILKLDGSLD